MYMTMSISSGLYPNLDLWNANKLQLQLQWIFKTWDGVDMEWIDLAQGKEGWREGACECCNKTSSSINCGEFLDCEPSSFTRKDSVPRS